MIITLAVGASACSSGATSLDSAQVTRALAQQARRAYAGISVGRARCPQRVTRTLTCTVELQGVPLQVRVSRDHHNGKLVFQALAAVLTSQALQYFVQAHLSLPAAINCGPSVQIMKPAGVLSCDVAFVDGSRQSIHLRVLDVLGNISIEPTS